jgi:hypothetical protein
MRRFLLPLAILGVLCVGAAPALSQEPVAAVTAATVLPLMPDQTVMTPVRWVYRYPGWQWGGYYAPYSTYYYGPAPVYPYRPYAYRGWGSYYAPGFGFYYGGPRRSFGFGF